MTTYLKGSESTRGKRINRDKQIGYCKLVMMLLTGISVSCRREGWVLVPNCVSRFSDTYLIDVDHIDQPIDGYPCCPFHVVVTKSDGIWSNIIMNHPAPSSTKQHTSGNISGIFS